MTPPLSTPLPPTHTLPLLPIPLHPELSPWLAVLLPVTAFPVSAAERATVTHFASGLRNLLLAPNTLHLHLYLQVWTLMNDAATQVLDPHLSDWWPIIGCGIWPDRDPPQGWTEERLSDSAASMFTGEEIPLMNHKLLRLSIDQPQLTQAAETMSGYGPLVEIFSPLPIRDGETRIRTHYVPTIVEKRFRNEKFYAPLLDRASLAATKTAVAMDENLGNAHAYLRESAEDKGLIFLWRSDRLPHITTWLANQMPNP